MPKYHVYGVVTGTSYLGEVEAANEEEAAEKAWRQNVESPSLCHQCSREISDPEIEDIYIEAVESE